MQETSLEHLLNGGFGLLKFAPETLLSEPERQELLSTLEKTPYTFEYGGMPPCWGKAFENFLTVADYLEENLADNFIQELCTPMNQKIIQILEKQGLTVAILKDPKSGKSYWTGDFRWGKFPAHSSILHVDDLALDGHFFKSDFQIPTELKDNNWVQLSFLYQIAAKGNGCLRIYDKKYNPELEKYRLDNNWQFADEAVKSTQFIDFQPQAGDFYLMPNQYLHDILGNETGGEWTYYSLYALILPQEKRAYLYI